MASFVSSSLKTGRLIFIWPLDSLQSCQPWWGCLEPPNLLDLDNMDEEVDAELWSLSNLQSGEGKGDGGGAAHNSHCPWPQSWPHCGSPTLFLVDWPGAMSGHLPSCSSCWEACWLQRLVLITKIGPLGSMHPLVMAWVIIHQPSPRLTRLSLSWACLPTQLMGPDSMNTASNALPTLSPSNDCHP